MTFDYTVQHVVKSREGSENGKMTPYLQLSGLEGSVILQDGNFIDPGGYIIPDDEVPNWAWALAETLTPQARLAVGFDEGPPSKANAKPPRVHAGSPLDAKAGQARPMQLNAPDPDEEDDGTGLKAEPVPQGRRITHDESSTAAATKPAAPHMHGGKPVAPIAPKPVGKV